jgi:hypothetical protein
MDFPHEQRLLGAGSVEGLVEVPESHRIGGVAAVQGRGLESERSLYMIDRAAVVLIKNRVAERSVERVKVSLPS